MFLNLTHVVTVTMTTRLPSLNVNLNVVMTFQHKPKCLFQPKPSLFSKPNKDVFVPQPNQTHCHIIEQIYFSTMKRISKWSYSVIYVLHGVLTNFWNWLYFVILFGGIVGNKVFPARVKTAGLQDAYCKIALKWDIRTEFWCSNLYIPLPTM